MRISSPFRTLPRRSIFLGVGLIALISCGGFGPPRGDILFITIDTLRADHVGYAGSPVRTPTLDSLALAGCRFEQAVTATPLTLPSHCTMMTGLWPHHHGVRLNEHYLGPAPKTLAEVLKRDGYATAAFVGAFPLASTFGLARGFDHYDDAFETPAEAALPSDHRFRHERRAQEVVDATLAWLDGALKTTKPNRLFLWVHLYDPHDPYEAPEGWREGYAGEIEYTDREVGRLLRELRARGRAPQLVVVAADHGEGLGEHDEPNHGLFLYDTTIRVPLLLAGKGVPAGASVTEQVSLVDLLPSLLELRGVAPPSGLDGASFVAAMNGAPPPERPRLGYIESLYAVGMGWSPLHGVRSREWKYISAPAPELYALETDPGELSNLTESDPRRAVILADGLEALRAGEVAPAGVVSEEQMERLRSLGYLAGGSQTSGGSRIDPKSRAALAHRIGEANQLFVFGKTEEAIARFEEIRAEDPKNPFVLLRLGHLHRRAGRAQESVTALRAARLLDPMSSEVCYQLGETYFRAGLPDSAITWYRRSLAITPERVAALANIGAAAFQKGDYAMARDVLSQATLKAPDDGRTISNLALADLMLGNMDAAYTGLLRARALLGDAFISHYELGIVHLRRKEVEPALRSFALAQGPRRPDALIELAVASTARSQFPLAVEQLTEAIQLGGPQIRQRIANERRLQALLTRPEGRRLLGQP